MLFSTLRILDALMESGRDDPILMQLGFPEKGLVRRTGVEDVECGLSNKITYGHFHFYLAQRIFGVLIEFKKFNIVDHLQKGYEK